MTSLGSTTTTHGIEVRVVPEFLPAESSPKAERFVFGYHIVITNHSRRTVQLLERHWIILDADGDRRDVRGSGVVGQRPILQPGQSFDYRSGCPLSTPWGTMEGTFTFRHVRRSQPQESPEAIEGDEALEEQLDTPDLAEQGRFFVNVGRFFLVTSGEHLSP
jgi:ApaG protein